MENLWDINEFAGVSIRIRKSDGFICATDMTKINPKKVWYDYFRRKQSKEFISILKKELGTTLIESNTANCNFRGTWVHPRVATHLAMWISPKFSVEVTKWIEEWKAFSEENKTEYLQELCKLEPSFSNQKEKAIQLELQSKYNGKVEVETAYGFVDLMYEIKDIKYIVEIKEASKWKHALGQILCYGAGYPNHKKVIVLFGLDDQANLDLIRNMYEKFDIELRTM